MDLAARELRTICLGALGSGAVTLPKRREEESNPCPLRGPRLSRPLPDRSGFTLRSALRLSRLLRLRFAAVISAMQPEGLVLLARLTLQRRPLVPSGFEPAGLLIYSQRYAPMCDTVRRCFATRAHRRKPR